MSNFLYVVLGEMAKIHKTTMHSPAMYFSLFLWPILTFFATYYAYKPFDISQIAEYGITSFNSLMIFLVTGLLGYYSFWTMVQSAWMMSYERQEGTLEIVFVSPASRIALVYGRALGTIIQNMWMLTVFSVIIIFLKSELETRLIISLTISLLLLLVAATVWGGFMNAIFLFSRDASFLFNIFEGQSRVLCKR